MEATEPKLIKPQILLQPKQSSLFWYYWSLLYSQLYIHIYKNQIKYTVRPMTQRSDHLVSDLTHRPGMITTGKCTWPHRNNI
jgi:hypothetical protein